MTRLLPLFLISLALSACGFHPVHGTRNTDTAGTSTVAIAIIPDREGQILRNQLMDMLHSNGTPANPEYTLTVDKITETDKELAITKSSEATRAQLRLKTRMKLANRNGVEILSRDIQALTSYNILESEFATRVTENSARENAIHDLARQIELQVNLYLNRQK